MLAPIATNRSADIRLSRVPKSGLLVLGKTSAKTTILSRHSLRPRNVCLVRPTPDAAEFEVVGIGLLYERARVWLEDAEGNSILLCVVDRLLLGFEKEAHLRKHVIGAGPAHERIDLPRRGGLVLQHPLYAFCPSGLHGGFSRLIDACKHDDLSD